MKTKVITSIFCLLIILNIIFYILLRNKSAELSNKCMELSNAEIKIKSLQSDNDKLVEYLNSKDKELEKIQKDYKDRLANIPADKCGDVKPSDVLLKYLRRK